MNNSPVVSILMGSKSDWSTMKYSSDILKKFNIHHESKIISAHRTPDLLFKYAEKAEYNKIKIIIAGAGGAAHLPGMLASKTHIPVLGVPIEANNLFGQDSLLSIVQMPKGIPVATFAIGKPGAINAAIFACSILSVANQEYTKIIKKFRTKQTLTILNENLK